MKAEQEPTREALRGVMPGFEEVHPALNERAAVVEADRCLQCGGPMAPAPCTVACPADIDIPKFILQIKDGLANAASDTIFSSNVLGGSCARVCPVDELCEGACVMKSEGRRPVEIGRLQRYATDHGLASGRGLPYLPSSKMSGYRVGVIGAGPAGLACAAELAKLGYWVEIFEKRGLPGGLVTYGIAPYKQRLDPICEETEQVQRLGVNIHYGSEVGTNPTLKRLKSGFDAVFIGVGMGADASAQTPGSDLAGVWESLPFIETLKLGLGDCFEVGRRVVVIGGGNTAIDVVREALRLGPERVTLVYRRDEESMPAFKHEVRAARDEGAQFEFLAMPVRILGEDHVTGVECVRIQLGEPDSSGRRKPVPVPDSEFVIKADLVVTAIGQVAHSALFQELDLHMEGDRVSVDEAHRTSDPIVFAGGDCVNGGDTVVEAIRHGKLAAAGIHRSFSKETSVPAEPERKTTIQQDGPFTKYHQGNYYLGTSVTLCKGCNLCTNSCPADILFLDQKSKIQVTDVAECVFCGICEARCPDFAIWIVKDQASGHPVESEAARRLAI